MTTANELISGALRAITSITPGEAIPGSEADNALTILNRMLKMWSAQGFMIPFRTLESFALTIGKASYTIGQSGSPDFNTVRPDQVTFVFRRDSANQDYEIDPYTKEQYNRVFLKSLSGTPDFYYYDPQYPNGTIYLVDAPSAADTLFIESLKPINQFATLQTVMLLPGEYEEAIVYLLAQRLAPEYGASISPEVADLIKQAQMFIKSKNAVRKAATFDAALLPLPIFDIRRG